MSAFKIQTPGNYPKESIQHTEHGESLKSSLFWFLSHIRNQYYTLKRDLFNPSLFTESHRHIIQFSTDFSE